MPRYLFTPRWLVLHALLVAAVVTCLILGRWQWDRATSAGGSLQNYGYALQWPSFAVFFVYMWWRMMRLEARRLAEEGGEQERAEGVVATDPTGGVESAEAAQVGGDAARKPAGGSVVAARARRPVRPAPVDEEPDDELAAYNRYLAELNARAQDPDGRR
ncbi:hypothetical protein LX15_001409 [Streptoalloteichus tenebrarius]|uniref:DNA-binding transcriptional regulator of glucitol operon n=1 Tax=Streptoalloteichus tenebrarius (strain ATCC 17920 / DSM 40477 / JCM 4838 / CBS 697.72 / NBRC 16177 / NCIMB 11028 / NRRL B-12390 / A12253. 1 / ISP 5477) TaxID=1933 RepID=A0ABT1HQE3_STRSD|nr:hypothetical protein [Streptoalloteichus tenebrarius]MCP2257723.1 hypothetical protein [Streptoalloteichus tenebrarius]BFE99923.1 hypothetical protein GCM10020241_15990 [Streptoalloteichus tenebrarius]